MIILCKLVLTVSCEGDVRAKSWFEGIAGRVDKSRVEWFRLLVLSVRGLGWNSFRDDRHSEQSKTIDLNVELQKPTSSGRAALVEGDLSFVEILLKYTDYVLLKAVLLDNVGRTIDESGWDNVEKAYWSHDGDEPAQSLLANPSERDVIYSSNARFVRYGTKSRQQSTTTDQIGQDSDFFSGSASAWSEYEKRVMITFKINGIVLTLFRDDDDQNPLDKATKDYAMILLQVAKVEASAVLKHSGDLSCQGSLFRIMVIDLGDRGRPVRKNVDSLADKPPCAFSVLVEGYSPPEKVECDFEGEDLSEPDLVVNLEACAASSLGLSEKVPVPNLERVLVARVVINYLSINPLVRPIREIGAFLTCQWHIGNQEERTPRTALSKMAKGMTAAASEKTKSSGFQLKVVAHYPRLLFVADESDASSRALVLKGYVVDLYECCLFLGL